MHYTLRARAKREADRLFLRLCKKQSPTGTIEIWYPERYRMNQGLIVGIIPVGHVPLGIINQIAKTEHETVAIINSGQKTCLRIIRRFPTIAAGDVRLLERAKEFGLWAEKFFGMPTTILSFSGVMGLRWRAQALV